MPLLLLLLCWSGQPGLCIYTRQSPCLKSSMLVILFLSTKQRNMQAKGNDLDGIERLKAELDSSSFKNNPEVLTAYVR